MSNEKEKILKILQSLIEILKNKNLREKKDIVRFIECGRLSEKEVSLSIPLAKNESDQLSVLSKFKKYNRIIFPTKTETLSEIIERQKKQTAWKRETIENIYLQSHNLLPLKPQKIFTKKLEDINQNLYEIFSKTSIKYILFFIDYALNNLKFLKKNENNTFYFYLLTIKKETYFSFYKKNKEDETQCIDILNQKDVPLISKKPETILYNKKINFAPNLKEQSLLNLNQSSPFFEMYFPPNFTETANHIKFYEKLKNLLEETLKER